MKKRGFTYIEVMIALAIFSIFIMFLMNVNHNSAKMASSRKVKLKEIYIAQMEMERWKSNYSDEITEYYMEINGGNVEYKDLSGNQFKSITLLSETGDLKENDKFYVNVNTQQVSSNILDVVILVKKDKGQDDSDGQKLESHILMN